MTARLLLPLLLLLTACGEETAPLPPPVPITAETAGHYCQMGLLEHEGPKGQAHLAGLPTPLFFAQVRDLLAYLRSPEQSHAVAVAYVQDMTGATWAEPGPWIRADAAVYVLGAGLRGGMGAAELVPFATAEAAGRFAAEQGGEVRGFAAIAAADVLAPDAAPAGAAAGTDIRRRLDALAARGAD
ncbi:MAG: nitrous oxide reductase accessory protein NosL [Albimonas sp.]|uniref:nitrous oxide reductase accessory protein NosL n=1 Tax=Albimonas sp. TaxID=1872425 RepID=UPI004055DCAD